MRLAKPACHVHDVWHIMAVVQIWVASNAIGAFPVVWIVVWRSVALPVLSGSRPGLDTMSICSRNQHFVFRLSFSHIFSSGKCVSSQLAKHTKAVTAAINAFVRATVVQQFTIAPETVCRIKYSRAVLLVSKHWQTASVTCTVCTEKPAAVTTRVPGDVHTLLVLVLHINNFSHLATAKKFSHLLAVVIQEGVYQEQNILVIISGKNNNFEVLNVYFKVLQSTLKYLTLKFGAMLCT